MDQHGADLHGVDLHGADLHGVFLHGVVLNGVDLHVADLHGVLDERMDYMDLDIVRQDCVADKVDMVVDHEEFAAV